MTTCSNEMRLVLLMKLIVTVAESKQKTMVGKKPKSEIERKLEEINIYIACNYDRKIGIDSISRHVGMNRSSVCSFYKRHTGKTLVTYLNGYRLNMAKNMLKDSRMPIQQVCFECGFNDVPYFCRLFKKQEGVTPGNYRTLAK